MMTLILLVLVPVQYLLQGMQGAHCTRPSYAGGTLPEEDEENEDEEDEDESDDKDDKDEEE
jgi:hypothetical protein